MRPHQAAVAYPTLAHELNRCQHQAPHVPLSAMVRVGGHHADPADLHALTHDAGLPPQNVNNTDYPAIYK